MNSRTRLVRIIAISLAIGVSAKLLLLALASFAVGFEQARPLLFPGTGLVLAVLAFPFVRRHLESR